jgi:DNA-binding response OmpR family regulator/anti-sigma regulatory factor (Ser/Thr protein kinase)
VSHEFRTPLTLMLGPLEELLNDGRLSAAQTAELEMVSRNAQRLLRLVGTMLDFSQIEAGRLRARFAPVDLAERTRDIAAMFESAASRAGLTLTVDVDELPAPVWVDVEMWEKIVSNLLSNALKFTLAGEVTVTLRALPKHAELVVRDTGVGIPVEELPHIFKRFHRVRGARGRSDEGAGIGLALVDELVRRHHGRVRAISSPGRGAAFTVWVPLGRRPGVDAESPRPSATSAVAAAMAQEAMQWAGQPAQHVAIDVDDMDHSSLHGYAPGAHVLVADDNQDMRDYLARLLAPHWQADVARDGAEALAMARDHRPDLVLADVMMPGLDGFALLRELRRDPLLASVPVILVTARAGEESAIEGLLAGADDYIVKPFSARELVARVGGQLELARARQHAIELNAFRIRLSDALRELDDEREIQRTACRMVVEQLGADRARYVELDEKAQEFVTLVEYNASGMPAASGRYAMAAYAPLTDAIHAGRRLVIRDTQTDPAVASIRDALAELHIHAHLVVPLMRDGRSVSAFAVHQRVARDWTEEEVTLVEEIAGRAWAEVSRARAEAELRRVNAQMRDQLRSLTR